MHEQKNDPRGLPAPRNIGRGRAFAVVFILSAAAGFYALSYADIPLMRARYEHLSGERPDTLNQVLEGFRNFAQPLTLVAIVILIAVYDARRRVILSTLLVTLALTWIAYQTPKRLIARYRPFAAIENVASLDQLQWSQLWPREKPEIPDDHRRSFPSGHSATAFALATILAWFYRRLRWLFWILAVGCALSRFLDAVHWPSDCFAGAMIGLGLGLLVLHPQIVWAGLEFGRQNSSVRSRNTAKDEDEPRAL